jgi:uncharacterized protein YecE (DUF72 family)
MAQPLASILVGTAGWTRPRDSAAAFPGEGTHLERYSRILPAVEINSSFHRPHRSSTWKKWRDSVPEGFRFSVKLPKTITHKARLIDAEALLDEFLGPVGELGSSLGCLLVQLPPSLAFDTAVAPTFFTHLRERFKGGIACEPRHASWLEPDVDELLAKLGIARVAASPDKPLGAGQPGGALDLVYYRLHGSPRTYYSSYETDYLARLALELKSKAANGSVVWCIFDNTTLGAATPNALELVSLLASPG